MEVRGIVKGASGGGAFVVAAKELHASILAGSQVKHQLQSGAGPLTVEVSSRSCVHGWVVGQQIRVLPCPGGMHTCGLSALQCLYCLVQLSSGG